MIISLTGFMGCGKSSVGRRLSQLLCCPFMDLDDVIEQQTGRCITEIFTTDGEAAFRQMELDALRSIVSNDGMVEREKKQSLPSQAMGQLATKAHRAICDPLTYLCGQRGSTVFSPSLPCPPTLILSLGGGTVMTPECTALVHEQTMCIYLRTSVDTLVGRLANEAAERPLLAGADLRNRIDSLMSSRASTYERTAHHIIDTDGLSTDEVAQSLLESVISKLHCKY